MRHIRAAVVFSCAGLLLVAASSVGAQGFQNQGERFLDFSLFSPSSTYVGATGAASIGACQLPGYGPANCPPAYGQPVYGGHYYSYPSGSYGYAAVSYGSVWPQPSPYYSGWAPPGPPMVSVAVPCWPSYGYGWYPKPHVTVSTWQQPFFGYPCATVVSVNSRR